MTVDMYIFPYGSVEKGSRIILYGAGVVGKNYYSQLAQTGYAEVVRWIDSNYQQMEGMGITVESPEIDYGKTEHDHIVIAVSSKEVADQIAEHVIGLGADPAKIIWSDPLVHDEYQQPPADNKGYSAEKNVQILLALLKKNNISKIIASPGTTNYCFVASAENDSFFKIYSCVDERSAAYMACGMAEELGETVVLSCTGATASRNYYSGLTEAYYRKLPILAVTSSQYFGNVGNLIPQNTDRTDKPSDVTVYCLQQKMIYNAKDEQQAVLNINKALSELKRHGGGPVHINLETTYSDDFSAKELPDYRLISRYTMSGAFPDIQQGRTAVLVGSHGMWTDELTASVDSFCEKYNAVVFCNWNSNYPGKYPVFPSIVCRQEKTYFDGRDLDLLIHIGEVSDEMPNGLNPKEVWRVNPDGEMRDYYGKLSSVFEMEEESFFRHYSAGAPAGTENTFYPYWTDAYDRCIDNLKDLPFSNIWCAEHMYEMLPPDCCLHLGIMNTNRSWSLFRPSRFVNGFSNTGGFGIDGCVSSLIGASFAKRHELYIGIFGDLSFFYDLNSLGNRHIGSNLRIMMINNGRGGEFRLYWHPWNKFGSRADEHGAAAGHFGNMSRSLVKHYAEDLGFIYMSADSKQDFAEKLQDFLGPHDASVVFEVFVDHENDSRAIKAITELL